MSQTTEDLFDFPDYWPSKKLGKIAGIISPGFPCGDHNQEGEGVPHLRPMNISEDGEIDLSKVKYVEEEYTPLRAGDVLFNNTNSPKLVGKTAHIDLDRDWAHSNHMTRIRDLADGVHSKWVAHWLQFLFRDGYFRMHCRNHVNQASIGVGFLEGKVDVPIPPLSEQRRIIDKIEELFSNLDAGMSDLQTADRQLERYRLSVLQAAVEGRLTADWRETHDPEPADHLHERIRSEKKQLYGSKKIRKPKERPAPEEDEIPFSIPEGWSWVRITELMYNWRSGLEKRNSEQGSEREHPYIKMGDITNDGRLTLDSITRVNADPEDVEKYKLNRNDFLFNVRNSKKLVGKSCVFDVESDETYLFNNNILRVDFGEKVSTKYINYWFCSAAGRDMLEELKSSTTNVAAIYHKDFFTCIVPFPPRAEQRQIVDEVERLLSVADDAADTADREHTRAKRLRQSILKQAFSGQLVPHEDGEAPSIPDASTTASNGKEEQKSRPPTTDGSVTEESSTGGDDLLDGIDESNQIEMDL